MADILIKNIGGLPEDGDLTLTITPKGQVILGGCFFTSNFGKEVKAVAIPEHGDLKDCSVLLHYLAHMRGATEHDHALLKTFEKMIRECPTIVEANNE